MWIQCWSKGSRRLACLAPWNDATGSKASHGGIECPGGEEKPPGRCASSATAEQAISTAVIDDVGIDDVGNVGFCDVLTVEDFDDGIVAAEHAT